jgi:hypothetical protein
MSWNPLAQPVDYILLSGQRSPGIAEVTGASSPRRYDERRGYGLSGATVVFKGIGLTRCTVKLRLYTEQHWADWEAWKPLIDRPPLGSRPKALDIWHPFLEALEVKSVVVEDVSQPEQTDDGEWTIEIKFVQYRKPTLALAKPEGSTAAPVDPVDQKIENLHNQNADLARQLEEP